MKGFHDRLCDRLLAQSVLYKIDKEEGEKRDAKEKQREKQLPKRAVIHRPSAFGNQRTPRRQGFLHPKAEKADEAFRQDHQRHQKRRIDRDNAQKVRDDMA